MQLLDAVPFRFDQAGPYEAQLIIDVGYDRRHSALSLLISRDRDKKPDFCIVSDIQVKADHQHEFINPKVLTDHIVRLFKKILRRHSVPIESLLVLRDGQFCGQERQGIDNAVASLIDKKKFAREIRVDVADFRKDSLKAVRLWEVNENTGTAENPLDGRAVQLNDKMVVVTSTGAATLHQGTAQPFMIVGNGGCSRLIDAAQATFAGSQLNWSSPRVAQRLPLNAKRADEELKARADQEIKRFR
ncbi:MAG: hypothetical protein HWN69_02165 [Desulfobacterales bacterium]|nr:hypothetical protein [Desulfobacterales bacterium]